MVWCGRVVARFGTVVLCGSDNHWVGERNQAAAKHSNQRMLISWLLDASNFEFHIFLWLLLDGFDFISIV